MGMENVEISSYTYQKINDRKYSLKANLSNNQQRESANSNVDLPLIEPESNIQKEK